ncbi:MAG: 30S ribosomal protein S5 alanine N-acetyltransferase [Ponticaulis sp.]|nr:30S ribosomal protein S5 alanine N-acetyltransferase [Ponticaulis sp.]
MAWYHRFFRHRTVEFSVEGADFILRLTSADDYVSWREIRTANYRHLQPFEPVWADDSLSRAHFLNQVRTAETEFDAGLGAMLLMVHQPSNTVIGGINLRNVRRGVAQMGTIGYWIAEDWGGQGRMTKAVSRVVEFGFKSLGLHRIEAACVPENTASANVLLRAGFQEEGFARAYLKINGRWRDHRLFAIVYDDILPESPA